jgi:hypothetical protein
MLTFQGESWYNKCYISFEATFKTQDTNGNTGDQDEKVITSICTAPIDQIESVTIVNDSSWAQRSINGNNLYQFKTKYLRVQLKSKSLISHYTGNNSLDIFYSEFNIAILEGEENLDLKLKKAIVSFVCQKESEKAQKR